MIELVDQSHVVTAVDHEAYRTVIHLADDLRIVIESIDHIHFDEDIEPIADLALLDTLTGSTVQRIAAEDRGTLVITTASHTITVPSDPDYEAWSVISAITGALAAAMPGGGVAHRN
ncbi:MAG: hypothetical protein JHC79_19380 [Williamsia sp.]|nr:hypothetical protein [Williamsia sp.]